MSLRRYKWPQIFGLRKTNEQRRSAAAAFRRSGRDRRRHERVRCYNLVKCLYRNERERDWVSNLKNLSVSGVKLFCPEAVSVDDVLKLVVNFASLNWNLSVSAKVVWQKDAGENPAGCEAGLCFLELEKKDRAIIENFVREASTYRLTAWSR